MLAKIIGSENKFIDNLSNLLYAKAHQEQPARHDNLRWCSAVKGSLYLFLL